jgi:hypothetical protein
MTEQGGDPWTRSHCLWGLGVATWLDGDDARAEGAEKEALRITGGLDERTGIALTLETLAWISASRRDYERSARLQGAALSVWESIPKRLPEPLQGHTRRCQYATRRAIGRERHARLFEQGRRLDRAAAVALGLEQEQRTRATTRVEGTGGALSEREFEVRRVGREGFDRSGDRRRARNRAAHRREPRAAHPDQAGIQVSLPDSRVGGYRERSGRSGVNRSRSRRG